MNIDETIKKWIEETETLLLNRQGQLRTSVDDLLFGFFLIFRNYIYSIGTLLNEGRKLPSRALLRSTGELIVKILWCLNKQNKNSNTSEERFERWRKSSLAKLNKFRKDIIGYYSGDERLQLQKAINQSQQIINKISQKKMPNVSCLFEKVYAKEALMSRAGMYLQYLGAVHIDLITLSRTQINDKNELKCVGDCDDTIYELWRECLIQTRHFLGAVYRHFGLDFQRIQNEYENIMDKTN